MLWRPACTGRRRAAFLERVQKGVGDGWITVAGACIPGGGRYVGDRGVDFDGDRSVGVVHRPLGNARSRASLPFIATRPMSNVVILRSQDRRYAVAVQHVAKPPHPLFISPHRAKDRLCARRLSPIALPLSIFLSNP